MYLEQRSSQKIVIVIVWVLKPPMTRPTPPFFIIFLSLAWHGGFNEVIFVQIKIELMYRMCHALIG